MMVKGSDWRMSFKRDVWRRPAFGLGDEGDCISAEQTQPHLLGFAGRAAFERHDNHPDRAV